MDSIIKAFQSEIDSLTVLENDTVSLSLTCTKACQAVIRDFIDRNYTDIDEDAPAGLQMVDSSLGFIIQNLEVISDVLKDDVKALTADMEKVAGKMLSDKKAV